jgi:starvation-inducible outer membrane lipoprotein
MKNHQVRDYLFWVLVFQFLMMSGCSRAPKNLHVNEKCSNDLLSSLLQKWMFPAGIEPTTTA